PRGPGAAGAPGPPRQPARRSGTSGRQLLRTGASSRRQVAPACLRSDSCESLEEQYLGVPDFFEGRGTPYASIAGGAPGEGGGEALTRQAKPRGQAPPGAAAGGESPH